MIVTASLAMVAATTEASEVKAASSVPASMSHTRSVLSHDAETARPQSPGSSTTTEVTSLLG